MSVEVQDKQDTIDQVLDKIKQAIDGHSTRRGECTASVLRYDASKFVDEDVLELSDAIDVRNDDSAGTNQLSALIKNFTQRINGQAGKRVVSEKEVEAIFRETLRPYLKSWLNSNLHAIIKPVLETEVRMILRKLFNVTR